MRISVFSCSLCYPPASLAAPELPGCITMPSIVNSPLYSSLVPLVDLILITCSEVNNL